MLTPGERRLYTKTTTYKMIFILSGYRLLTGDSGGDIVCDIRRIWMEDDKVHETITSSFMLLIDLGYVEIGEKEVRAYFDHMHRTYPANKIPADKAFANLKQYAETQLNELDFEDLSPATRALEQAKAITYLNAL